MALLRASEMRGLVQKSGLWRSRASWWSFAVGMAAETAVAFLLAAVALLIAEAVIWLVP